MPIPPVRLQLMKNGTFEQHARMYPCDGRTIDIQEHTHLDGVFNAPRSLLESVAMMSDDYGTVLCNSQRIGNPPFVAFAAIPTQPEQIINPNRQWLAASTQLDATETLGFRFKQGSYFFEKLTLVPRIGTLETPMLLGPAPKSFTVIGVTEENQQHVLAAYKDVPPWQLLEVRQYPLDKSVACSSILVIITEWHPGCPQSVEQQWPLGLYAMQLQGKHANTIKLPQIPAPEGFTWVYDVDDRSVMMRDSKITFSGEGEDYYLDEQEYPIIIATGTGNHRLHLNRKIGTINITNLLTEGSLAIVPPADTTFSLVHDGALLNIKDPLVLNVLGEVVRLTFVDEQWYVQVK